MQKVYLDNAATTQIDPEVLKAMQPYFNDDFGNASSLHSFGQAGAKAVEDARDKVAKFLNCKPEEIIFTSGATEADNLAIQGLVRTQNSDNRTQHIITTSIEHPAVLEVCKALEKDGVEVSYVKPQSDGIVRVEDIEKEIKDNTLLISVMYVNNEIGTIQPIKEIGELIKKINQERVSKSDQGDMQRDPSARPDKSGLARDKLQRIYFHTDAVQAVNYLPMDVNELGVDLVSISGHKIYGPKGVGVLYVRQDTPLNNIQHGGHHEGGLRPGTLNVPGIVGMAKAVEMVTAQDVAAINPSASSGPIGKLRDYCWQQIQEKIQNVKLNGSLEQRVPNNLNISIAGVEGEAMMLALDLQGIAISTGSACSSGSLEPSHVLMAIGLSHEESHGSLRITLGKKNTQQEIDYFVEQLVAIVTKLRKLAP